MRVTIAILIALSMLSCGRGSKKSSAPGAPKVLVDPLTGKPIKDLNGDGKVDETDVVLSKETDAMPLELVPAQGSQLRYLSGKALTIVYGRIFTKGASGWAHCDKDKPRDYKACDLMFAAEERASVGSFDMYSQRMHRGQQNVSLTENLTLNYMRSVRAALGRECAALVDREQKTVAAGGGAAANILVKEKGPDAATLEAFMRKLLDVEGTTIDLGLNFPDYVAAWEKSVATHPDMNKAKSDAYVNLCITLGMDPIVFLF